MQKSRFRSAKPKLSFLFRTFFTKQEQFYAFAIDKGKKTKNTKHWCFSISCWWLINGFSTTIFFFTRKIIKLYKLT
ncbi:hypothetical protein CUB97_09715 [Prevotella intermedia]|uniref:Uncharacterized protein n=1 Tax=Prevotella intermedia TaxID=28131 RepID=A0A2M8M388_PREIN|nr:hypothetical protein CUB97_09715 [Prevotella intermedia]